MIPNNQVWRPCDAVESAVAWKAAIERKGWSIVPGLFRARTSRIGAQRCAARLIEFGGYVLSEPADGKFDLILIATGSEVGLAMQAQAALEKTASPRASCRCRARTCSIASRSVSRRRAAGSCRKRVAIEAGVTDYWRKYVGLDGAVVGIDRFGASAPAEALFKYFGFTVDEVVAAAKRLAYAQRERSARG
jgi:transketolase